MILPLLIAAALMIGINASSKPKSALPVSSNGKGVIFTCSYIEITDLNKFRNGITTKIENYFNSNNINNIDNLDIIGLFGYIIKQYNPSCYNKIQSRTLKSTEKIVIGIFIAEILKVLEQRLFGMEANPNDPNYQKFIKKIDDLWPAIREWLQITQEFEQFEGINDAFMKNLKYPIK
jgi:hypothetical protein